MSLVPLDQRPGVLQDLRPFYDDLPPRIGSGDFLPSEQPAPFTNPFRRISPPQATLHQRVHSRPTSSDLRPPLSPRGQRSSAHLRSGPHTLRSATAATSSRSSTDTMENCRVGHLRARVYRGETRLSVEAQAIETDCSHPEPVRATCPPREASPNALEPRLLGWIS
ncbi:hypothetical protein THAOC_09686 [Thalassiosira oceanica]|uniref:Uncharacterized protein n=1 Tax=Thalassiosira oceanica TaxID=159749 RepID=K0SRZ4_THAOC|nr:hypothetical protein THAOC_09686 [Thalassiosira oceanica]|eukprot:EJK69093.1 hypothetical protein THAOC_09686 [Thalassiosira oceanica]